MSSPPPSTSSLPHHQPIQSPRLPPRGILKHRPGSQDPRSPHLTWDEPNLALNDLNRDSTMKITEPKTPFVRYNAETDEVMNLDSIPDFDLGRSTISTGQEQSGSHRPSLELARSISPPAHVDLIRRASSSSRRGSDSTERRQVLVQKPSDLDNEGDEDDEELDPDSKAKHDAFVRARKGHYGNEAEAMKRAKELAEQDDTESEITAESDTSSLVNGAA